MSALTDEMTGHDKARAELKACRAKARLLRADNDRLREALEEIDQMRLEDLTVFQATSQAIKMRMIARAALAKAASS